MAQNIARHRGISRRVAEACHRTLPMGIRQIAVEFGLCAQKHRRNLMQHLEAFLI